MTEQTENDPWTMEPRELMLKVSRACAAVGRGTGTMDEASYFCGVARARLEGKTPPFKSGDRVRVRSDLPLGAREFSDDLAAGSLSSSRAWTVDRVCYGSLGDFGLRLVDDPKTAHDHIWQADAFESAPDEAPAS